LFISSIWNDFVHFQVVVGMTDKLLTVARAAAHTKFSPVIIRRAAAAGEIKSYQPGKGPKAHYFFKTEDLDSWLESISNG
jgi:excisionase family DNA binding protein